MKVTATGLSGVLLIQPKVFGDDRGFFTESWNKNVFNEAVGQIIDFVQDNHSRSSRGVLRGIHYQVTKPQGKLVRVTRGTVLDVAVDLRKSSPTFGQWESFELSESNHAQVWIPPGFGHAFAVLSDTADFLYKTTEFWMPQYDRGVRWNDPDIGIVWRGLDVAPILASKDASAPFLKDAEVFE